MSGETNEMPGGQDADQMSGGQTFPHVQPSRSNTSEVKIETSYEDMVIDDDMQDEESDIPDKSWQCQEVNMESDEPPVGKVRFTRHPVTIDNETQLVFYPDCDDNLTQSIPLSMPRNWMQVEKLKQRQKSMLSRYSNSPHKFTENEETLRTNNEQNAMLNENPLLVNNCFDKELLEVNTNNNSGNMHGFETSTTMSEDSDDENLYIDEGEIDEDHRRKSHSNTVTSNRRSETPRNKYGSRLKDLKQTFSDDEKPVKTSVQNRRSVDPHCYTGKMNLRTPDLGLNKDIRSPDLGLLSASKINDSLNHAIAHVENGCKPNMQRYTSTDRQYSDAYRISKSFLDYHLSLDKSRSEGRLHGETTYCRKSTILTAGDEQPIRRVKHSDERQRECLNDTPHTINDSDNKTAMSLVPLIDSDSDDDYRGIPLKALKIEWQLETIEKKLNYRRKNLLDKCSVELLETQKELLTYKLNLLTKRRVYDYMKQTFKDKQSEAHTDRNTDISKETNSGRKQRTEQEEKEESNLNNKSLVNQEGSISVITSKIANTPASTNAASIATVGVPWETVPNPARLVGSPYTVSQISTAVSNTSSKGQKGYLVKAINSPVPAASTTVTSHTSQPVLTPNMTLKLAQGSTVNTTGRQTMGPMTLTTPIKTSTGQETRIPVYLTGPFERGWKLTPALGGDSSLPAPTYMLPFASCVTSRPQVQRPTMALPGQTIVNPQRYFMYTPSPSTTSTASANPRQTLYPGAVVPTPAVTVRPAVNVPCTASPRMQSIILPNYAAVRNKQAANTVAPPKQTQVFLSKSGLPPPNTQVLLSADGNVISLQLATDTKDGQSSSKPKGTTGQRINVEPQPQSQHRPASLIQTQVKKQSSTPASVPPTLPVVSKSRKMSNISSTILISPEPAVKRPTSHTPKSSVKSPTTPGSSVNSPTSKRPVSSVRSPIIPAPSVKSPIEPASLVKSPTSKTPVSSVKSPTTPASLVSSPTSQIASSIPASAVKSPTSQAHASSVKSPTKASEKECTGKKKIMTENEKQELISSMDSHIQRVRNKRKNKSTSVSPELHGKMTSPAREVTSNKETECRDATSKVIATSPKEMRHCEDDQVRQERSSEHCASWLESQRVALEQKRVTNVNSLEEGTSSTSQPADAANGANSNMRLKCSGNNKERLKKYLREHNERMLPKKRLRSNQLKSEECLTDSNESYDSSDMENYEKFVKQKRLGSSIKRKSQLIESYYTASGKRDFEKYNMEPKASFPVYGSYKTANTSTGKNNLEENRSSTTQDRPKQTTTISTNKSPTDKGPDAANRALKAALQPNLGKSKFIKTKFIILKGDICDKWLDIKKKTGFGDMSDPKFIHYLLRLEETRQQKVGTADEQKKDANVAKFGGDSSNGGYPVKPTQPNRDFPISVDLNNNDAGETCDGDVEGVAEVDISSKSTVTRETSGPAEVSDPISASSKPATVSTPAETDEKTEVTEKICERRKRNRRKTVRYAQTQLEFQAMQQEKAAALNIDRKRTLSSDTEPLVIAESEIREVTEPDYKRKCPYLSKATENKINWAVNVFKDWLREKGVAGRNFESKDAEWLDYQLQDFYVSATNVNGVTYSADALQEFRRALSLYLCSYNCRCVMVSIALDKEYSTSNLILTKLLQSKVSDSSVFKTMVAIYDGEIDQMYRTETLSDRDPLSLLRKVWFDITYHLCKETFPSVFWKNLKKEDLSMESDCDGVYYSFVSHVTSDLEDEPSKMYATPDRPDICPVRTLSLYLSKLSSRNNVLFQCPLRSWLPGMRVWYSAISVGQEGLDNMMIRISFQAKLHMIYSNISVMLTAKMKKMLQIVNSEVKVTE